MYTPVNPSLTTQKRDLVGPLLHRHISMVLERQNKIGMMLTCMAE